MKKPLILKPGKEKAILNRHHWIFSGAVQSIEDFEDGEILPIHSSSGQLLGYAYFNSKSSILGRMVSFGEISPMEAIQAHIDQAILMREKFFSQPSVTNAYRLINGEGDCLPGLIVDRYADTLVLQVSTLGMEKLLPWIVDYLNAKLHPKTIYEKSNLPSRKEEGLKPRQGYLAGEKVSEVEILEIGLKFLVHLEEGQKTGFFLDHREMRHQIRQLASGKKVLNCFSYTGGFTVAALAGGALSADSVEISEKALEQCKKHVQLNGFQAETQNFFAEDVFQFLRQNPLNYDLVVLDPPAFAKRRKDIINACRGYKDINRLALEKMPSGSLLLTCSCSHFIDETLFQKVVFQAASEAGRTVRIIGRHLQAPDHPVNIYHPEGDYLKSLLLFVSS